jgi:hypothetical protein
MPLSAVILIIVSVLLLGDAISYAANGDLFSAGEHVIRAIFTLGATLSLAELALRRSRVPTESQPGRASSTGTTASGTDGEGTRPVSMNPDLVNQMNRALDTMQSQIDTLRAAMAQGATAGTPTTGTPAGDARAYRDGLQAAAPAPAPAPLGAPATPPPPAAAAPGTAPAPGAAPAPAPGAAPAPAPGTTTPPPAPTPAP